MNPFEEFVPSQDRRFCAEVRRHLLKGEYDSVVARINERLQELDEPEALSEEGALLLKAKLAGFLIDAGSESNAPNPLKRGMDIYETSQDALSEFITVSSIEYNLGNAKSGLYAIEATEKDHPQELEEMALLTEAKNHYWRAQKGLSQEGSTFKSQVRVNLGNALRNAGRVAEALQCYDEVLERSPEFPQANANRSLALQTLSSLSSPSQNLLWQAQVGYRKAARGDEIPPRFRKEWNERADQIERYLKEAGYSGESIEKDVEETRREFESHNSYRQFCLVNFLALNEHSLYCFCNGAAKDSLGVATTAWPITGEFVPRMEHRLNRLKSEFQFARYAFFEAHSDEGWEEVSQDASFTELYEAEAVGLRHESMRVAFRMCFGILDKVAFGLCELFELEVGPGDHVYFHSFWKKKDDWWKKLRAAEPNAFLSALYSQATDLSPHSNGEWAFYRDWRNALEHALLVVQEYPEGPDIHDALESEMPLEVVSLERFRSKALHLLQFTRSAIFNFAFCARVEGWKNRESKGDDSRGMRMTLEPRAQFDP